VDEVLAAHLVVGFLNAGKVGHVDAHRDAHEQHLRRLLEVTLDGLEQLALLQRTEAEEVEEVVPVLVD